MKKSKMITIVLILSLCLNVCCGVYFVPKVLSNLYGASVTENYKYDARLSTFKLNKSETDIVFVGDSITAYIDWNEFFPSSNLLNRGIEGDTWGGVLLRIDEVTERHPHTIVLMVGINDIAAGSSSSEILQTARQVVGILESDLPNTEILLCDVLPSPQCPLNKIQEVNTGLEDICRQGDRVNHLCLSDLYLNSDGTVNTNLFSEDGVHLNGDGYSIWIGELKKHLHNKGR